MGGLRRRGGDRTGHTHGTVPSSAKSKIVKMGLKRRCCVAQEARDSDCKGTKHLTHLWHHDPPLDIHMFQRGVRGPPVSCLTSFLMVHEQLSLAATLWSRVIAIVIFIFTSLMLVNTSVPGPCRHRSGAHPSSEQHPFGRPDPPNTRLHRVHK